MKKMITSSRWFKKRALFLFIGVGLAIVACSYIAFRQVNHKPDATSGTTTEASRASSDVEVSVKVNDLIASGDIDGMLKYYDTQAALIKGDPSRLQMLRMNQSLRAVDAKRYDAALTAAKQADEALSSAGTLGQIAQVYELKGDKKNAIAYYTKARDAVPVVKAGRFNPTQQYDDAIARLSQ